jgi:hypothetical protein
MILAAVGLMLPSLIWGTLPSHSSPHNLTWAAQMSEQIRHGIVYPRWLPDSFRGLGAPTFYFYPPLAFWFDGLVSLLTLDVFSTSYRLSITSTALLWLSGLAMHTWLRLEKVDERTALFGALAYMAAPYHLVEHYVRGAIAEFAAYAALPLVMCGVVLMANRRGGAPMILAGAYAALVCSHLPMALLASLTAIPAYVLFVAARHAASDRWFVPRCGCGFVLGVGLAAVYLGPALSLQDAILIESMWTIGFKVETSYVLRPGEWMQGGELYILISSSAAAWLLATLGLCLSWRSRPKGARRSLRLLWICVSLACLLFMSGLAPWFWTTVPMVSKVQFPWRLLLVVEFAALTALCLEDWPIRSRSRVLLLWLAVAVAIPGFVLLASGIAERIELALKGDFPAPQDAREYLPAHYPQPTHYGYADLGLAPVEHLPLISCTPQPQICRATEAQFGGLNIEVESDVPATIVLRRFYFPAWRLDQDLPLTATDPLRLLSFVAPAGHTSAHLGRAELPPEKLGWRIAALSLLLLITWSGVAARRRKSDAKVSGTALRARA